jgi:hypothetical protein
MQIFTHYDVLCKNSLMTCANVHVYIKQKREKKIQMHVYLLVGSRDHRTQFWKGAIQGPFHQSLVEIGPVASEELIKM